MSIIKEECFSSFTKIEIIPLTEKIKYIHQNLCATTCKRYIHIIDITFEIRISYRFKYQPKGNLM